MSIDNMHSTSFLQKLTKALSDASMFLLIQRHQHKGEQKMQLLTPWEMKKIYAEGDRNATLREVHSAFTDALEARRVAIQNAKDAYEHALSVAEAEFEDAISFFDETLEEANQKFEAAIAG